MRHSVTIFNPENKMRLRFDDIYIKIHYTSFHLSFNSNLLYIGFVCYKFSKMMQKMFLRGFNPIFHENLT